MSREYDQYLEAHKENVVKGLEWLEHNIPSLAIDSATRYQITHEHDRSKNDPEEYDAYDKYFYGRNRSYEVVNNFNRAWLHHIHHNPHHWQHWVLINDDAELGNTCIEMPQSDAIEMICDWWSFSWKTGNLQEIFTWYDAHKDRIELHPNTLKFVEDTLRMIKEKLDKDEGGSEHDQT